MAVPTGSHKAMSELGLNDGARRNPCARCSGRDARFPRRFTIAVAGLCSHDSVRTKRISARLPAKWLSLFW